MKLRLGIKQMRQIAIDRRGRCLSNKYINAKTHLEWECAAGHRWKAVPDSVKRGTWCPSCSGKNAVKKRQLRV
jgi:rubredoxin